MGHAGQIAGPMAHGQPHHGMAHGHHPQMGNQVNAMGHPGSLPNSPYSFGQSTAKTAAPPKSNTLVFVLIAVLIAAIGVLAYLVATKQQ